MKKFNNIILALLFSSNISYAQVFINEIMSSNLSTIVDEDGSFSDWIEIYNSGEESVDLESFSLSDDLNILDKWQFPQISIDAGHYVLIFASGKTNFDIDILHSNFKLKASGESIYLSNPDRIIIDSLTAVKLIADVSYGRSPDGTSNFTYFESPTPDQANGSTDNLGLITEIPTFSLASGYVSSSGQSVLLSSESGSKIHYTKNGSQPTTSSEVYSSELNISSSMVIKARIIEDGKLPGPIVTQSYIIESEVDDLSLPMISISADHDDLFGDSGLFNFDPGNLEKQVYFEFYDSNNESAFSSNAGMKIFGNESGTGYHYQQSLAFFARSKYGDGAFNYRLFREKDIDNFESFIMRNDNGEYNIFDAVGNGLVQDILDVQAFQPVVVFINGEYWGILNMMEKINEHYITGNFKINADSVDVLNGFETDNPYYHVDWPIAGNIDKYAELTDFLQTHDLSIDANYQKAKAMIDIPSYATYQIAEIFMANVDWPGNNTKFWREKGDNGKWRWIVFDIDAGLAAWTEDGFDATYNTLEIATAPNGPSTLPWGVESTWPNPPWSTFILRSLLENNEFENFFIATLCDLMATNFNPEISKQWVDARADLVIKEIDNHENRWDVSGRWYIEEIKEIIKDFLDKRGQYVHEHFKDYFNLSGELNELNISLPEGGGSVKVNNKIIVEFPFRNNYFEDLSISLTAIPDIGFEFVKWEGVDLIHSSIEIIMNDSKSLSPKFLPIPDFERIVINEICYADAMTNDWIELFNPTEDRIDLSNWKLTDSSDEPFIFPQGSQLNSGGYLVVSRDIEKFKESFNSPSVVGDFNFGLSKRGDHIFLYNQENQLIDHVEYKTVYPWPVSGYSLALIDPMFDNAYNKNWMSSEYSKTPGAQNESLFNQDQVLSIGEQPKLPLFEIFPNPLSAKSVVKYVLKEDQRVVLKLYDIHGRLIKKIIDEKLPQGNHISPINMRGLEMGIYFITMQNLEGNYTSKVLVID